MKKGFNYSSKKETTTVRSKALKRADLRRNLSLTGFPTHQGQSWRFVREVLLGRFALDQYHEGGDVNS